MQTYIVEVLYEQVVVLDNGRDNAKRTVEIAAVTFEFESQNKEAALTDAQAHMAKVLEEGLELSGGPVLKSVIPPAALKSVGLIDHNAFVEEMSAMEELSNSSRNENQSSAETVESASAST